MRSFRLLGILVLLASFAVLANNYVRTLKNDPSLVPATPAPAVPHGKPQEAGTPPSAQRYRLKNNGRPDGFSVNQFPWPFPLIRMEESAAQKLRELVIHKDENILVLNKPGGVAVNISYDGNPSIQDSANALRFDASDAPVIINRLDRPVSGALVMARNKQAYDAYSEFFAKQLVRKTYWAILTCKPKEEAGVVEKPLITQLRKNHKNVRVADEQNLEAMQAVTEYRVLATHTETGFTLVELRPATERTHQLRVHMQALGCPILGDDQYAGPYPERAEQYKIWKYMQLHAKRLELPPYSGPEHLVVDAPLPPHMGYALSVLKLRPEGM